MGILNVVIDPLGLLFFNQIEYQLDRDQLTPKDHEGSPGNYVSSAGWPGRALDTDSF